MRISSLLIANRGEIAVRIIRTARRLGMRTVAVHSDADRDALHVRLADEAVAIGPAPAAQSYLRGERIIEAALARGVQAIHPGYGFLSESDNFAQACADAGLIFVGPPPSAIRAMGLKDEAKALMQAAGVPVVPGYHGADQSDATLLAEAQRIGVPLLIKATAGGGGKGMKRVDDLAAFPTALESARREALAAFGNGNVLLETWVSGPRHIEVQVFADAHGNCVHLFERDCSLQRRHQKVIEEAPAPGLSEEMRAAMTKAACSAARAVGYVGAGTVEFIAESGPQGLTGRFWFMEMNTRLQVEHPVSEAITGLDLVEWQLRVAAGEPLPLRQDEIRAYGHAVEARLYAEDPQHDFLPSTGRLVALQFPQGEGLRVDAGLEAGDVVTPFYDPMIAKIIAHGATRDEALSRLSAALAQTRVAGPRTNVRLLRRLTESADFRAGRFDTGFIAAHAHELGLQDGGRDALAIRLGALALVPKSGSSPWEASDGFQLSGARRQVLRLDVDGEPCAVELVWPGDGSLRAVLEGEALAGDSAADDVVMDGKAAYVLRDGLQTIVRMVDPFAHGAREDASGDAIVRAPMHGRVVALFVQAGDAVGKGQRLAIVEAMKMEHVLVAGVAGRVAQVQVAVGAQVALGGVLMSLHPGGVEND